MYRIYSYNDDEYKRWKVNKTIHLSHNNVKKAFTYNQIKNIYDDWLSKKIH